MGSKTDKRKKRKAAAEAEPAAAAPAEQQPADAAASKKKQKHDGSSKQQQQQPAAEAKAAPQPASPSSADEDEQRRPKGGPGRRFTVTMAVPGSIIDNTQNFEMANFVAGQVGPPLSTAAALQRQRRSGDANRVAPGLRNENTLLASWAPHVVPLRSEVRPGEHRASPAPPRARPRCNPCPLPWPGPEQVARTAAVFNVDELVVVDDTPQRKDGTVGAGERCKMRGAGTWSMRPRRRVARQEAGRAGDGQGRRPRRRPGAR
jgi:hypothetical protein